MYEAENISDSNNHCSSVLQWSQLMLWHKMNAVIEFLVAEKESMKSIHKCQCNINHALSKKN